MCWAMPQTRACPQSYDKSSFPRGILMRRSETLPSRTAATSKRASRFARKWTGWRGTCTCGGAGLVDHDSITRHLHRLRAGQIAKAKALGISSARLAALGRLLRLLHLVLETEFPQHPSRKGLQCPAPLRQLRKHQVVSDVAYVVRDVLEDRNEPAVGDLAFGQAG